MIKIHRALLGLFQGNMVLLLCGIGRPELYKALLMAVEESQRKMTETSMKITAVAISPSFLAVLPRRFFSPSAPLRLFLV